MTKSLRGQKREWPRHVMLLNNECQFIVNISVLAIENAEFSTAFGAGSEWRTQLETLVIDTKIFAAKWGVKLPAALDNNADRDYQLVVGQVGTTKFDKYYLNECKGKMNLLGEN